METPLTTMETSLKRTRSDAIVAIEDENVVVENDAAKKPRLGPVIATPAEARKAVVRIMDQKHFADIRHFDMHPDDDEYEANMNNNLLSCVLRKLAAPAAATDAIPTLPPDFCPFRAAMLAGVIIAVDHMKGPYLNDSFGRAEDSIGRPDDLFEITSEIVAKVYACPTASDYARRAPAPAELFADAADLIEAGKKIVCPE